MERGILQQCDHPQAGARFGTFSRQPYTELTSRQHLGIQLTRDPRVRKRLAIYTKEARSIFSPKCLEGISISTNTLCTLLSLARAMIMFPSSHPIPRGEIGLFTSLVPTVSLDDESQRHCCAVHARMQMTMATSPIESRIFVQRRTSNQRRTTRIR
ncbi:hypothetical protein BC826DRAFT_132210 [Russula brevipes]|nr:hypothetical protein BC826DRAFT_132210 [Russula brevipes]